MKSDADQNVLLLQLKRQHYDAIVSPTRPASTAVYLKVIEPLWADETASGKKFFESVVNCARWRNMFKSLDLGDLFVIVVKGSGEVAAVGEVAHPAQVKETRPSVLKAMLAPGRHESLDSFLNGAESFDYVQFALVFDCRNLRMAVREFLDRVGLAHPETPPLGLLRARVVDPQHYRRARAFLWQHTQARYSEDGIDLC